MALNMRHDRRVVVDDEDLLSGVKFHDLPRIGPRRRGERTIRPFPKISLGHKTKGG